MAAEGVMKVVVVKGSNLVVRDTLAGTSDPFAVLIHGSQKLETSVKHKTVNPHWNEALTFHTCDPSLPVKLVIYDADKFSDEDSMGFAHFSITDIADAARMNLKSVPSGSPIKTLHPIPSVNCLAAPSNITWHEGKLVQDLVLTFRNAEHGSVALQVIWEGAQA